MLETEVLSIFMRWFDDEIVSTTKNMSAAARTLNINANLTINPDPLLRLPLLSTAS